MGKVTFIINNVAYALSTPGKEITKDLKTMARAIKMLDAIFYKATKKHLTELQFDEEQLFTDDDKWFKLEITKFGDKL